MGIPNGDKSTNDDQIESLEQNKNIYKYSSARNNMSKDELTYMINKLNSAGFYVNDMTKPYAEAIPKTNGGSGTSNKKIFFSKSNTDESIVNNNKVKRKQKNEPKNIDNKKRYLNPFVLAKAIKNVLP